jgi:hypothetical protein
MRYAAIALILMGASLAPSSGLGQSCPTTKCTPTGSPKSYFCDVVCSGGACTAAADTCPGHCLANPGIECVNNGPCPGADTCSFSSTVQYGHCQFHPDIACVNSLNCIFGDACVLDSPYTGDKKVTICGSNAADTITGTGADNVICGNNGNDTIRGGGGNDIISGGNIADYIVGGPGDDIIHGDGSADTITGCGGRDFIFGDADHDSLKTIEQPDCPNVPDDVVGAVWCGGPGNDSIVVYGPAHQCIDGGPDQGGPNQDCIYSWNYITPPRAQTSFDIATGKRCSQQFVSPGVDCGCGD